MPTATPDSGIAPLEIAFDGSGSTDPENETLTYAWDFDGDGETDSTDVAPTHTYTQNGVYDARLTVTDPAGKTGTATVPITVGNTRPEVDFGLPPTGSFFNFGDAITWDVSVTDAEDSPDGDTIDDEQVIIQPALGHDAHAHPAEPLHGRTGTIQTSLGGGHSEDMNVFYVIDARYTDDGGEGGVPALTGSDTTLIFPKKREAEFTAASEGTTTIPSRDVEGGGSVITGADGAWASYDPVSLYGVEALNLRVAAADAGTVELRRGAADGELLGTAEVPQTGLGTFTDVRVEVTDPMEPFTLYVVFPGAGERRLNFIEADGKAVSDTTRPKVRITAPEAGVQLEQGEITVAAEAEDTENTVTEVEFFVDGTSIGTDTEAPYEATWEVTADNTYELTAVATNDKGLYTRSRIVVAQVGDLFAGMSTFTNANGTFEQLAEGRYLITSGGANMWQGTNEYSTIYREQDADANWSATVRINSQGNSNGSAKAGIIVRNDVAQTSGSLGYAALGMRPSGGFEWLRGNASGQLATSSSASTTSYPAWVRIVRDGDLYTAFWSKDGATFTQIGEPQTLPGAAAVQDVGMFVTAHSTTATSAVEFQDFVFDDDPVAPEEPGDDVPPQCLAHASDEFDGDDSTPGGPRSARPRARRSRSRTATRSCRWSRATSTRPRPVRSATWDSRPRPAPGRSRRSSTCRSRGTGSTPVSSSTWTTTSTPSSRHEEPERCPLPRVPDRDRRDPDVARAGGRRRGLPDDDPPAPRLGRRADHGGLLGRRRDVDRPRRGRPGEGRCDVRRHGRRRHRDRGHRRGGRLGPRLGRGAGRRRARAGRRVRGRRPRRLPLGRRHAVRRVRGRRRRRRAAHDDAAGRHQRHGQRRPAQPRPPEGTGGRLGGRDAHEGAARPPLAARRAARVRRRRQLRQARRRRPERAGRALDLGAELVSEKDAQFGNGGNRALDIADSTESGYWYLRLAKVGDTYQGWVSDGGVSWQSLGEPVTNDVPLTSVGLMAIGPEQETPVTVAFDWFRLTSGDEEPEVAVDAEVSVRCLAGKAYVAVRATNADEEAAAITLATAYGSKEVADVAVGANAYHAFAVRAAEVAAGAATVTATIGDRTATVEAPYDAVSCG
ncbi:hypothetical protein BJF88_05965 [Cellulosimicrobium sp. CUA-896]|nr:hypothetical protein BJF88_05965 [Cellulosimicrobium sp. CUA-896]